MRPTDPMGPREPRRPGLHGEQLKVVLIGGAIVLLGLFAVLFPHGAGGHHKAAGKPGPRPSASSSGGDVRPAPSASAPVGGGDSASPSPTVHLPKVDLRKPDTVASDFAHAYFTRFPDREENHGVGLDRAAPWMSDDLAVNLATHEDPYWDRLLANGAATSSVTGVSVGSEGSSEPPDNPLRVYRKVTVRTHVTGRQAYDDTRVLHEEVSMVDNGKWKVTALIGLYKPAS